MLREAEIRSREAEKTLSGLAQQDMKTYFLDKSGEPIDEYFVEIPCPACGENKNCSEFEKGKFIFKRCELCNTLYVSPRPKPARLLEYCRNSRSVNFFMKEILEKTMAVRKEKIFNPRAERVIAAIRKSGISRELLVEVGGANGLFLEIMKERKAAFGRYLNIEPSEEAARLTKERGFEVINDFAENAKGLNADCVCAFELIEHVFDPLAFCNKVNGFLASGGLFIMTTPNIEGFDLMLLGRDSDNIGAPAHLNYFSPGSIRILLERAGFEQIEVETPGHLDVELVKNKFLEGHKIKDGFVSSLMTKSRDVLDNFQTFLQQNGLSSNMWISCRKK